MGIARASTILVEDYAQAAIEHGLAGAAWVAVLFQASLALTFAFYLILQLFPTGGPLSPRWRILVWLTVASGPIVLLTPVFGAPSEFKNNFPTIKHQLNVLPIGITNAPDAVDVSATYVHLVQY